MSPPDCLCEELHKIEKLNSSLNFLHFYLLYIYFYTLSTNLSLMEKNIKISMEFEEETKPNSEISSIMD